MEQTEEKQLQAITDEFGKGVEAFKKRECQQAVDIFTKIVETYKDTEFYSVTEIQARSQVYLRICDSRLNPVKLELQSEEDYLSDGLFLLNAGELDKALERFKYLEEKNYSDPYLGYLFSLVYARKEEPETCMEYLTAAIEKDEIYRVIAHNEPDFELMLEHEEFVELMDS